MTGPLHTRLGVLGLGAMGGAVALAARDRGLDVRGYDPDPETRDAAASAGLTVSDDLSAVDLVVLAAPMPALTDRLRATLDAVALPDHAPLTDLGSLKAPVQSAIEDLGLAARFVGGHPMTGTDRSGFGAAAAVRITGSTWVVTPTPTTPREVWRPVVALATGLGAEVAVLDPAAHDAAMGLVSGLPHLLALGLESALAGRDPVVVGLAAGSFGDLTRVASSDPTLLHALIGANGPAVRQALRDLLDALDRPVDDLIWDGRSARQQRSSPLPSQPVTMPVDDTAGLLALGRAGARILGVPTHRELIVRPSG